MIKRIKKPYILPLIVLFLFLFISAEQKIPVEELKLELINLIDKNMDYNESSKEFEKYDLSNKYTLKELHEIFDFDDPRGLEMCGLILNEIQKSVSKKINLNINEKNILPSYVTFSNKIKNKFECINVFADDTIHLTEFDFPVTGLKPDDKVSLSMDKHFINVSGFFIGDPGIMHESGYKKIKTVKFENDILDLSFAEENRELILFTIIKSMDTNYFYKVVWIIKRVK